MTVDGGQPVGAAVPADWPDATLDGHVDLPVSRTGSCCFGGPDLRDFHVTTTGRT